MSMKRRTVAVVAISCFAAMVLAAAALARRRRNDHAKASTALSTECDCTVAKVPSDPPVTSEQRTRAMQLFQVLKKRANEAFQEGRYEDAVVGYQDCIGVTSALGSADSEAVAAEQIIRANVVMAFLKLQQYDDARMVATMLLEERLHPLNDDLKVKVLHRRGLASKALSEADAAIADFKAALHFSPNHENSAAKRELELLARA